ncbi:MAG: hypothetical protein WAU36_00460 [Cyclobacteriaceae bacterium]
MSFSNLRGYLYIGLGIAFGIYSARNAIEWGAWELLELLLSLGMTSVGVYIIVKK